MKIKYAKKRKRNAKKKEKKEHRIQKRIMWFHMRVMSVTYITYMPKKIYMNSNTLIFYGIVKEIVSVIWGWGRGRVLNYVKLISTHTPKNS